MKRRNLYLGLISFILICAMILPAQSFNYYYKLFGNLGLQRTLYMLQPSLFGVLALQTDLSKDLYYKSDTTSKQNYIFMKPKSPQRVRENIDPVGDNLYQAPEYYDHLFEVDSSGTVVKKREVFDSSDISQPYNLTLEEYLNYRKQKLQGEVWDSLVTRYDIKKAMSRGDLSRMLSSGSGFTIPIPDNPLSGLFGKPEININVNGEANIRLGYRWDSQNLGTVSAFGQTQSSPMFSQDIRVNVSGGIGDKLKLSTDWNTRRTFDYDNEFKIGYDGYDDDIIKKLEVGYVSLPLTTQLISGGQALFGVRGDFQFGPLYLKTLYSQKRGQRKIMDVEGGSNRVPFEIRAYDYSKNHFFLHSDYKNIYRDYFKSGTGIIPSNPEARQRSVKEIEVWESVTSVGEINKVAEAIAIADLPSHALNQKYPDAVKNVVQQDGKVERGRFMRLDSNRYRIDRNLGTLTILNMRQDRKYAVAYRTEGPSFATMDDDLVFGTLVSNGDVGLESTDTMLLQLVYVPNLQPAFDTLWARQMKNKYSINATNVNLSDTKIAIWYRTQNNDSTEYPILGYSKKLVYVLGVDRVNNSSGQPQPDGLFDMRQPFFDAQNGEITFPHPEPFDQGLYEILYPHFLATNPPNVADSMARSFVYDSLYEVNYDIAKRNMLKDRFSITGEVSGRASNRIPLGAYNLAEGSVRITLDGIPLTEYIDYVVDYYAGTVTMRNPRASLPNANLKIEYEQQDVFNITTRTLAGLRADYQAYKGRNLNADLGFTFMHYDQSAILDRVRLGDEPVANSMFGFDGKLKYNANWLTKALDFLPFYDTKVPSTIELGGEWAMMLPNPNKRKSEVPSDNGASVVYIDDFEGAQRYISLGLTPSQWQHSSSPVFAGISADSLAKLRGKMFWYQKFIPYVNLTEVYPNQQTVYGRSKISPLEINFDPETRGIYNNNPMMWDTSYHRDLDPFARNAYMANVKPYIWAGMMKLFSSFNTNFETENIEFIEIMAKFEQRDPANHKLYIELGKISEDIIPNGKLNSEDGIGSNPMPNGIIDIGEDLGLDGLADSREKDSVNYPFPLNLEDDPAKDNYRFNFSSRDEDRNPMDFKDYNNFEGNSTVSELGQFPDTEVLNDNNGQSLSASNDYYQYEIDIENLNAGNPQIVGGNPDKGWYLFRIPIRKPSSVVGNPSLSNIQYIRFWGRGGNSPLKMQIADWRLVGSHWQKMAEFQANKDTLANDTALTVSFVNRFENQGPPDNYRMPPGVKPPRQINNPDPNQNIELNEQSLAVSANDLKPNDERIAVKLFRPMDLFSYKKLKFFVHGKINNDSVEVFMRFGSDPINYYQYKTHLKEGWQDVEVDFQELIRKKLGNPVNPNLSFKGNPILNRIQFFGIGIKNNDETNLTTTIWVDELRLIEPENSADWAGIGTVDVRLADLGQISGNIRQTNPNFHRLEETFGDRATTTDMAMNVTGNLEKFAPKSFKNMKLPISYSYSNFDQKPKYQANNDLTLDEAAQAVYDKYKVIDPDNAERKRDSVIRRSKNHLVKETWGLQNVQLGIPISHWLVDYTLNKLNFSFVNSREYEYSPVYKERTDSMWTTTVGYSLGLPKTLMFSPMKWAENIPLLSTYKNLKINPLPTNFTTSLNMLRRKRMEQIHEAISYDTLRDFSANRLASFSWKFSENGFLNPSIDYSTNTISTLAKYELNPDGTPRRGWDVAREVFFKNGNVMNFGDNTIHTQGFTLNIKPILPNVLNLNEYLDMTGTFTTNYNWNDPLQTDPTIRNISKTASFNNVINFRTGFKLKSFANNLFGIKEQPKFARPDRRPGQDTAGQGPGSFWKSLGLATKTVLFDFDRIDIIFNQTNSSLNPGVMGGDGMNNFWGRGLTFRESQDIYGPSFAYQLGLINSPHGGFNFEKSDRFPYFSFSTYPGLRPANGTMQDNFTQQTTLEAKTQRPLWKGATLSLNWKTNLGFNKNQTVITDGAGNPTFTNIIASESFNRTFISLPSVFGINLFGNTIDNVIQIFAEKRAAILSDADTLRDNKLIQTAVAESFYDGLEAFSFTGGRLGKFLPAMNWDLRWEGLEKFFLWDKWVKKMSFEHIYQSQYQEGIQITDIGKTIENQTVQTGFNPLIGFNATFDEKKLRGTLTASLRWASMDNFVVSSAARATISGQSTNEISAQASYVMKGFDWKLLGFRLKNDVEVSFMGKYTKNRRSSFDILDPSSYEGGKGRTVDGNTQIMLEPRIRYNVNNQLTTSFFVRYEGQFTEGAAQPGFHSTQVGLDLKISLSGGR